MVVFLWEGKDPCLFPQYSGVYHWMYPYQPTWAPYGKSLYYVGIYEVIILIRSPAKYHGAHIGLHPSLSFEKKNAEISQILGANEPPEICQIGISGLRAPN